MQIDKRTIKGIVYEAADEHSTIQQMATFIWISAESLG